MQVPLQIVLRDVAPYDDVVRAEVESKALKLEQYYPRIISCRVVVDKPHKHHNEGNLYRATVTVNVPDKQIVVSHEHPLSKTHEDIFVAVNRAFDDAGRQLKEYALQLYRDVKDHDVLPHGLVSKLFAEEGYGFITTFDGLEVYFHRNSVLDGFDKLKIGSVVRFAEEMGEKGPQASTVKLFRKEHAHHRRH